MKLNSIFGALADALPNYERRPQQQQMAEEVASAFSDQKIALIEAGTGTGKSIAYLIPAVVAAVQEQKRTVISTHTINLQHQLVSKDIPLVLKVLEAEIKAVLVKGMNNYVCIRRLEEAPPTPEVDRIERWAARTDDGTRSSLPFYPDYETWDSVKAESDLCNPSRCPHRKSCFFLDARKSADEAQLLVVNHHLLLADIALKEEDPDAGILPDYDHLIIDEAHHLEDVATRVFATKVSRAEIIRTLGHTEKHNVAEKRRLVNLVNEYFYQLAGLFPNSVSRVQPDHLEREEWNKLAPDLIDEMKRYAQSIRSSESDDIKAMAERIEKSAERLDAFLFDPLDPKIVRWVETGTANIQCVSASLEISEAISTRLLDRVPSIVLTSATMTTGGTFDFLKGRLGIEEAIESVHTSPFAFDEQGLFVIPSHLPAPTHPQFTPAAAETIFDAICACQGNAFVLFTSFKMMRECREILGKRFQEANFPLLVQGDEAREAILKRFRETERAVLFGSDSFWEGVDVAGDKLRCVIIAKLPFQVPTEPIIQARLEAITQAGGNPFMEYSVPQAIVKLKQGVGRLIRNGNDRGCVVCLDTRLINKPYGRLFLASLPPFPTVFNQQIRPIMQQFYAENTNS